MSNTGGTPPHDGFSLEPNLPDEEQVNIVFENCESYGNKAIGSYIFNWQVRGDGTLPPVSITFRNCNFHDNGNGAFYAYPARPGTTPITGTFDFIGCTFQSNAGRVIAFNNCLENGIKFTFSDCKVIAGKGCTAAVAFNGSDTVPFGNIDLGNLQIIDEIERQPFDFGSFITQGISTLTGKPTYQVGMDGKPQAIDLTKFVAANQADKKLVEILRTVHPKVFDRKGCKAEKAGPGDEAGYDYRFRGSNRYIQCVPKGKTARIRIKVTPFEDIPELQNPKQRVTVTDKSGIECPPLDLTKEEQVVELKAERDDQVYVLSFNSRNTVNVCSDSPGHGMVASSVSIANSSTQWYFNVPADCETVNVLVNCPHREYVTAEMMDATGKVVAKLNRHDGIGCLRAERSKTAQKEMWSLRFTEAVEDYSFTLGDPLEPIVFTAPANSIVK
ncbi:MAG: right-handed parallel beta-helix repeat-containing protein [Victivallales bacterium]|nr:right-handed parallel beta-helix repeat-containing protein [Victivallales bacterium]